MIIHRASVGRLQSQIHLAIARSTLPAATTPRRSFSGTKRQQTYEDDLSGQEVPRSKSPFVETLRKNWVPIGGTALLVAVAYGYFTFQKSNKDVHRDAMSNAQTKSSK